jgi:hypothetical protein
VLGISFPEEKRNKIKHLNKNVVLLMYRPARNTVKVASCAPCTCYIKRLFLSQCPILPTFLHSKSRALAGYDEFLRDRLGLDCKSLSSWTAAEFFVVGGLWGYFIS